MAADGFAIATSYFGKTLWTGGPPPSAIHGRGAATATSLQRSPCAMPALGLWGKGQQIKIRSRINSKINSFASRIALTVGLGTGEDWSADGPPSQ